MNEMATVEYLLRLYAENFAASKDTWDYALRFYYLGKAEMAQEIIEKRYGMTFHETDAEYIAENGACKVKVKKGRNNGKV